MTASHILESCPRIWKVSKNPSFHNPNMLQCLTEIVSVAEELTGRAWVCNHVFQRGLWAWQSSELHTFSHSIPKNGTESMTLCY